MVKLFKKGILRTCLVLILLSIIISNLTFAIAGDTTSAKFDVKGTFNGAIDADAKESAKTVSNVLLDVLTVVRIIGMAIAIIMLIYVGIKIMVVSPSEKANIKQYLINYVIGAFILLGAYGILTIVKEVITNAFTD